LAGLKIPIEELVRGGGGEAKSTQRLRRSLKALGWKKHNFEVTRTIDGELRESLSHEIDHVKRFDGGTTALEIEWNNKDAFFDRDLDTFKRLHADGAISIGAIITRGTSLHASMRGLIADFARARGLSKVDQLDDFYEPTKRQRELIKRAVKARGSFAEGWAHAFVSDKFGEATTHWRKLEERVNRGVGNPCPLLLIGIPSSVVTS
jgi:Restriction endonuclease BglII